MKRKFVIIILVINILFTLTSCIDLNYICMNSNLGLSILKAVDIKEYDSKVISLDEILRLYKDFLAGAICVEEIDINLINIPKGEPDKTYGAKYSLFDSNGDGILDLHVKSARYYFIITVFNNKLIIWQDLSPYPYYYALDNGAFIGWKPSAAPMGDSYSYFILDYLGHEKYRINFLKYDSNYNGKYDDNDEYIFDETEVTKETWKGLTARYLYYDENEIEKIRNEIEWTAINN